MKGEEQLSMTLPDIASTLASGGSSERAGPTVVGCVSYTLPIVPAT